MAAFVDDYFDALFAWSPTWATALGNHDHDASLDDLSAAAQGRRIATLKTQRARLERLRAAPMSPDDEIDADILDGQIRAELLDLETLETWRKNPMWYVDVPGSAIDGLMKRNFAPAKERLRSVIARLRGVPALMDAMRKNVRNPPHEFTDLAIRIARGSVGFFRESVADWARHAAGSDTALLGEFDRANGTAAQSLEDATSWLEKTLLPASKGSYAIGADSLSKMLLYEEMVDIPLDRLLAIGEANLERDYQAFVEMARRIDPSKSPAELIASLSAQHPTEASLIDDVRKAIEGLFEFIRGKNIVTIPSAVRPTVAFTPPYARSGMFAAMDAPGPYETKATEAFYYVTPPEKGWSRSHRDQHLSFFNPPEMRMLTIHETYPGHYLRFLNAKHIPTKTRKLVTCDSNTEGWAHYTEQMMVEEGFGGGDLNVRLAQLHEALLRDVRYIVAIKLHTAGWTVERGAKLFEEKAFQTPANAYEEARRGAYDPRYLNYTLGKLQIYKLRDDYRRARGAQYSLQAFHDEFVKQGRIPIKAIRRILLSGDRDPTL